MSIIKKRNSLRIFFAVQNALFFRELGVRITDGRSGLFWTFFEPFIQIMIFVLIKVVIFGRSGTTFDYAAFIALNFLGFNLFKNIVTRSAGVFKANKALFVYKQVKPIDALLARAGVEIFITAILILVFYALGLVLGHDTHIKDLNMVAFGFVFLVFFTLSVSLVIAVANLFYQSVGKLVNIAMMGLMFGSAVIYPVDGTPPVFADFILINPLTHFIELIHGSYFYALDTSHVSIAYMLIWTVTLMFIGLWLYVMLEKGIITQ